MTFVMKEIELNLISTTCNNKINVWTTNANTKYKLGKHSYRPYQFTITRKNNCRWNSTQLILKSHTKSKKINSFKKILTALDRKIKPTNYRFSSLTKEGRT